MGIHMLPVQALQQWVSPPPRHAVQLPTKPRVVTCAIEALLRAGSRRVGWQRQQQRGSHQSGKARVTSFTALVDT